MTATTKSTTTGYLNYINPVAAPSNPQELLKIGLGAGTANSTNEIRVSKQKTIRNGRLSRFRLDRDGFELLQGIPRPSHGVLHRDPRSRFYSMRELVEPMAMRLVHERLGLKTCYYAFSTLPLLRKATAQGVDNTRDHNSNSKPHAMVHSDFGFDTHERFTIRNGSKEFNIRNPQKAQEVEDAFQKAGRMVVLQFWFNAQAEGTVIENDSLALCHPRSIQVSDLVSRPIHEYNGYPTSLNILQSKDSPSHEWFYWPSLATDECLVWIGYDSAWGDNMTPCFHTSFRDNAFPNSVQPRESIECRVYLLFDEEEPPPVIATLNYVKPEAAPASPKEILQVRKGQPIQSFLVGKKKTIQNARGIRFDLRKDGFELLTGVSRPHYSCFQDLRGCYKACNQTFLPLAVRIARERFGLEPYFVHLAPPYVRKTPPKSVVSLDQREHRSGKAPHTAVHNDYGFDSFQRMVDGQYFSYKNSKRAQDVRKAFQRAGRVMVLQFWMNAQPEGTVIENDSLALCHPRSVQVSDLVSRQIRNYEGISAAFSILHSKDSSKHEWFYWPSMTLEECLVWVGYDSACGDNMIPCFHTSFHDDSPGKSSARPRESVEARVHLLFNEQVPSRL